MDLSRESRKSSSKRVSLVEVAVLVRAGSVSVVVDVTLKVMREGIVAVAAHANALVYRYLSRPSTRSHLQVKVDAGSDTVVVEVKAEMVRVELKVDVCVADKATENQDNNE